MNKAITLKLGTWYRDSYDYPRRLERIVPAPDGGSFAIFSEVNITGDFKIRRAKMFSPFWHMLKPLHVLTAEEAGHLLAESYVLINGKGFQFMLDIESERYMSRPDSKSSWEFSPILDLGGLTIHMTPGEAYDSD